MHPLKQLVRDLGKLEEQLAACNRCGLCQGVCPIYGETLLEGDVSRGKLALLNNLGQELLSETDAVAERLSRCLLCGACAHACPSGVRTTDIFLTARALLYTYLGLSPLKKIIFRSLLPHSSLLNTMMRIGLPFRKLVMRADNNPQQTGQTSFFQSSLGERHLPMLPTRTLAGECGNIYLPGESRAISILFFPGCMGDKVYPDMAKACLRVLRHSGVAVQTPSSLVCCGLPALVSGDTVGFHKMIRQNLQVFLELLPSRTSLPTFPVDYIVTPCPSCTMTIRELWQRYAPDLSDDFRALLQECAARTVDITAFMVDILKLPLPNAEKTPPSSEEPRSRVTYHDPCHMRLSLGLTRQPRMLLNSIPHVAFTEMEEADHCCGCGGSFTLTQPELSATIGNRKIEHILETGADTVATACPACMMQLSDMLARRGSSVKVRHVMELFAETSAPAKPSSPGQSSSGENPNGR